MKKEVHQPTRALAEFTATLDPKTLPDDVRRKLGFLLLDFLRVTSFGARLPWSDWARRYVATVGRAGASHVLFSTETLNPQHATFLNVSFGSSYDADDTHVGAMLHPGVAAWSAALATAEHVGASGAEMLAAVVAG
jgi:2-methylcitrate dehydratase PrpD